MILINVKTKTADQNFTFQSDRAAQSYLQELSEQTRKHPYHMARKEVEKLKQIKDTWNRNHTSWRGRNTVKATVIQVHMAQNIARAEEALAMIDPPGPVLVNITKFKN